MSIIGYAAISNKDLLTLFRQKKSILKYLAWSTTPPKNEGWGGGGKGCMKLK
jgi:hypothetical protein